MIAPVFPSSNSARYGIILPKSVAIRLALALELDYEATQDFLGSAGYTLSQSIPADIIVEYYIRHGEHNAVKINIELDNYNQPLLLKTRE